MDSNLPFPMLWTHQNLDIITVKRSQISISLLLHESVTVLKPFSCQCSPHIETGQLIRTDWKGTLA